MIGMAGDDKNRGSLIVNMRTEPQEDKSPKSADMGLKSAASQILSAIQSGDADTLTDGLKSFINLCNMQEKEGKLRHEMSEGESPKQESRNRIGKGY